MKRTRRNPSAATVRRNSSGAFSAKLLPLASEMRRGVRRPCVDVNEALAPRRICAEAGCASTVAPLMPEAPAAQRQSKTTANGLILLSCCIKKWRAASFARVGVATDAASRLFWPTVNCATQVVSKGFRAKRKLIAVRLSGVRQLPDATDSRVLSRDSDWGKRRPRPIRPAPRNRRSRQSL